MEFWRVRFRSVGGGGVGLRRPVVALPVDGVGGRLGEALPPDVAVVGLGHVGEDRVAPQRGDGVGVGVLTCAGGRAEEAVLGVDRPQAPLVCDLQNGRVSCRERGSTYVYI